MSIQQAVNQALSTAGIAARLSPGYEQKQEIYQGKKAIESLEEAEAQAHKLGQTEAQAQYESLRLSRAQELAGKYPHAKEAKEFRKMLPMDMGGDLILKQDIANQQAISRAEAKKAQITNFRKSILLNAQGQNLMVPVDMRGKK